MEYRLLLLSVLVTMAYAKINKSARVMSVDTCAHYQEILRADMINVKYLPCNEQNADGEEMCYRADVACDSIADCNNSQDEKGLNCPSKHNDYCKNGFRGKGQVELHNCTRADWQTARDTICYGDMDKCDGLRHCPLGDDEDNCP